MQLIRIQMIKLHDIWVRKVKYALPSSSPGTLGTVATPFAFLSVPRVPLCPHLYVCITLACVCLPRCYEMTCPSVFIWMQEVATECKPREGCNIIESLKRVYFTITLQNGKCSSRWLVKLLLEVHERLGTVATLLPFSLRGYCVEKNPNVYMLPLHVCAGYPH